MKQPKLSQYLGVTKFAGKYRAQLFRKGKQYYLGTYDNDSHAAMAYDHASKITEAWTDRVNTYNFGSNFDTGSLNPDTYTQFEKDMLLDLRNRHPLLEEHFHENQALDGITGDAHASAIAGIGTVLVRMNQIQEQVNLLKKANVQLFQENNELKTKNAFLANRVTDLEMKNASLVCVPRDEKGKFVFKPVGVPATQPVEVPSNVVVGLPGTNLNPTA